jgi:Transglycosylase SLT domain
MGGKAFSDNIFKNEKTAKEVTGLAAQYVWETMIPTRFDLGVADVALTWATNKTNYGTPYVSGFEEGIPASKQVREDTSRSLSALTEYLAIASEGKIQISPRGAQMLGEALVPNIFELFTTTLDAGLGKAGILPEFPAGTPADNPFGKYFFIPDNDGLATQRFYTMYSNLQHDVDLVNEYKTDIERRKKAGYSVDIDQESMYLNLLEKNAPQIETHAILQKYNKDIMSLREQANAIIWDKDPTQVREVGDVGISDFMVSDYGSEYKRERLHEIKVLQGQIARQALEEVMTLPYGRDIVESNAVSFNRTLDPFINLIPVKQEKNATYDTKIDKYRLEDEDYIIEFEPLNNIQTMIENISVVDTIIDTAQENGINPNNALMIAALESRFNPNAQSDNSSATGVFQITDGTWKDMTNKRFGKAEYGITKKDDRLDPTVNIRMGILLMKEDNDKATMNLGRELNFTEQYALHHFGYGRGMEFIRTKESAPYTSIKDVIGSKAYNANPQFKKSNGTPMSVREAANMWTDRVNEAYKEVTTIGDVNND